MVFKNSVTSSGDFKAVYSIDSTFLVIETYNKSESGHNKSDSALTFCSALSG
eukprot:m.86208 g.86208  ORF g.86208 m.86208 type:complete len:52 (+) comp13047_c0_seq9:90-245(+)